jgi:endonuclease G
MTIADDQPGAAAALGYDPGFLDVQVPLPDAGARTVRELPYAHFTVLLDSARRLAALTAVNVDGASLVDLDRGDDWHLDDRVPDDEQCGPELYSRNDLDRGHLVRRRDPVWGTPAVASRANLDTFTYTNAAPQAAGFNQSAELWLGLEDTVLRYAAVHRQRLTVLTGPVLHPDDPVYRGVQLPLRFWKIAAWATHDGGALRTAGYLLDQSSQLDDADLERASLRAQEDSELPPLGPYRTFQVPVRDIAALTGLEIAQLAEADSLQVVPTVQPPAGLPAGWVPLETAEQLTF